MPRWLPLLMLVCGSSVLLAIGLWLLLRSLKLLVHGIRTTAEVVDFALVGAVNHPVVEFEDSAGSRQRAQLSVSATPSRWPIGTTVPIIYDPDNPSDASAQSFVQFWFLPILVPTVGGAGLLLGIMILSGVLASA